MKVIRYANPEGELGFAQLREDGVPTVLQFVDGVFVGTDTPASIHHHLWPVDVQTIFAIGLNYQAHAEESMQDPPEHPMVFMKPVTSLQATGRDIVLPRKLASQRVDFEGACGRHWAYVPKCRSYKCTRLRCGLHHSQ